MLIAQLRVGNLQHLAAKRVSPRAVKCPVPRIPRARALYPEAAFCRALSRCARSRNPAAADAANEF